MSGGSTQQVRQGQQQGGGGARDAVGRTVRRTVDGQGDVIEQTVDGQGDPISEERVGHVADLPAAEGYEEATDEQGRTTRTVVDGSGTLIGLQLGPDGSILDLQIPPPTEEATEVTEEASGSSRSRSSGAGGTR